MNAILGLTELILNDPTLSYKNRERLEVALRSARRLIALINSILDLSRIESGRIDMRVEKFAMTEFLTELDSSVRPLAEKKRLSFKIVNGVNEYAGVLISDRHKLMQILINLCGNAIKFTDRGFVELRVYSVSAEEVAFEVEDTGIGISKEEQEYIFEEFRQVDSSLSRKYEGSGLGLSISHKFTLLLKGNLTLSSVPGKGSTFVLKIPRELKGFPVESQTEPEAKAGYKSTDFPPMGKNIDEHQGGEGYQGGYLGDILIVDDDPDTLFTLNELVKKSGCNTLLAKNGVECLEILESAIPDMILMDLMMPRMDGFEAVKRIRVDKRFEQVPVIAITAKTIDDDGDELLQAGFTGYIRKPFDAAALISKIQRIFKPNRRR
jgi:two-component system chemotaxis sensor kinase CheA